MTCAYTQFSFSLSPLRAFRVLVFVQSQRCRFEIGKNGGPALFTESLDHGTLSGLPSRRQALNLFSALGCDRKFHAIAASAADGLHETVPLQRPEIPHQRRAIHPQPITQFRHVPTVLGLQGRQNRALSGTDSMPPHFRVIKLRHRPRHPTQIKAHAVLHRRHIQFFCHLDVYMHYLAGDVNFFVSLSIPSQAKSEV